MNKVDGGFYRDILIKGGSDFLGLFISLATIHILTKNLGEYKYGIFIQIQATTTLVAPVLLLRLNTAFVRYFPDIISKRGKLKNVFLVSSFLILMLQVLFAGILLFNSELFSKLIFNTRELNHLVVFITLFTFSSTFLIFVTDFFRAVNKIKYSSLIVLSNSLLTLVFISYAARIESGIDGFLLSFISSQIIVTSIVLILIFRTIFEDTNMRFDAKPLRKYLIYSLPLVPYSVLVWITQLSDRYLITHFLGLDKAGIYALSYNIVSKAFIIYTVIAYVIYPHISHLWAKGDSTQVKGLLEKGSRIYLYFAIPITAGLTSLSSPVISLIAGNNFLVSPYLVLSICSGFIFLGIYGIYSYTIDLSQKTYIATITLMVTAILNVLLNIFLIPTLDIMGAAITTMITYLVQVIVVNFLSRKLINIKIDWDLQFILKCLLAAGIMALAISRIRIENELYHLLVSVFTGGAIYILVTGILLGFKFNDLFRFLPGSQ